MCAFRNINCSHYKITYSQFEFMHLNNNYITELHEDLFISLPNIKTIDLRINLIKSISYNLFINNTKLEEIFLNNNKIKIFIVELAHILYLRYLFLNENPIEALHEGTLKYFFIRTTNGTKMMTVDFITNATCDCNANWIRRIKKEIKILLFKFENKNLNLAQFLKEYEYLENNCTLTNNNIYTNSIG